MVYMSIHIHAIEYYSAIKKKEILPFETTRVTLKDIILSEISQREKDKYYIVSFICGRWKKETHTLKPNLTGTKHCWYQMYSGGSKSTKVQL